ncbi:MAG: hypothetical protein L3J09_04650 [Flavobacteriaceae bacterium]|nr:hypothetical protein [Flavobacteriaceae bacterium]
MKIKQLRNIFVIPLIFSIFSCSQNTYDDIEEETNPIPEIVTYQDVKYIIDGACIACHSNPPQNGAPMSLVSFEHVKEAVQNRDLISKISKNVGDNGLMPLGGPRLPQSSIDLIIEWNNDGLLEN